MVVRITLGNDSTHVRGKRRSNLGWNTILTEDLRGFPHYPGLRKFRLSTAFLHILPNVLSSYCTALHLRYGQRSSIKDPKSVGSDNGPHLTAIYLNMG
jgi:hypothetical protein